MSMERNLHLCTTAFHENRYVFLLRSYDVHLDFMYHGLFSFDLFDTHILHDYEMKISSFNSFHENRYVKL